MELLFLGTGTSNGIPEIGCRCTVCTSAEPHNKRLRSSVLVSTGEKTILIDTSPDLRFQALAYNIDKIDAVCFTHHHADHIFGIDELRKFNSILGQAIPCYVSKATQEFFHRTFAYIFYPNLQFQSYIPRLELYTINGSFNIGTTQIVPVVVSHGGMNVYGFRIGGMAYLTDCNHIPAESKQLLHGLEILILDALRPKPHVSHFALGDAIREAKEIGAKKTYFTHIAHDMDHDETNRSLPDGIELAYDGLKVTW